MYKLVAVAGKLRGQEFELENGENIVGRDSECNIHLPVGGISKRHLSITVTGDVAYVQDLGSSNGTFLNGKLVKRATVKSKDKIALPDTILQVVYVEEKKIIIKKQASSSKDEDFDENLLDGGPPPKALPSRLIHTFKYKLMKILYGINEEYEWKILFAILLALFSFITISLTIFPVLQDSKRLLLIEIAKRGAHYADEIARMNARALEQKNLDQVDSNFLDREEGVEYELFDLEGRIVRPIGKLNEYSSNAFSVKALGWASKQDVNATNVLKMSLSDGQIGIAQRIMAYNARGGSFEAVGIIAIRFSPKSLAVVASKNRTAYLEALSTSALVAILFFGMIYFLTVRPLEELKIQIEDALRGKRKGVESKYLMKELNPLKNSINATLQRIRELQSDGDEDEFADMEDDESYVASLSEFMEGANGAVLILNSEKKVKHLNLEAEDLVGFRQSAAEDEDLVDICREQGFAGTLIELCDASANNGGTCQAGSYELGGISQNINVVSLIGRDNFAKAFYVTFVNDN